MPSVPILPVGGLGYDDFQPYQQWYKRGGAPPSEGPMDMQWYKRGGVPPSDGPMDITDVIAELRSEGVYTGEKDVL